MGRQVSNRPLISRPDSREGEGNQTNMEGEWGRGKGFIAMGKNYVKARRRGNRSGVIPRLTTRGMPFFLLSHLPSSFSFFFRSPLNPGLTLALTSRKLLSCRLHFLLQGIGIGIGTAFCPSSGHSATHPAGRASLLPPSFWRFFRLLQLRGRSARPAFLPSLPEPHVRPYFLDAHRHHQGQHLQCHVYCANFFPCLPEISCPFFYFFFDLA